MIDALIRVSDGDLRKAITYLQSAARLHNPTKHVVVDKDGDEEMDDSDNDDVKNVDGTLVGESITVKSIEEIAGVIPEESIDQLLKACEPRKGASTYPEIAKLVQDIIADGWSASQVVLQVRLHPTHHRVGI